MNEPTRPLNHSTTRLISSKCSLLHARSHSLLQWFFFRARWKLKLLSQHLAASNKDIHYSISLVEVWRWDLERLRRYWTYNFFWGGGGTPPKWRPGNADVRAYRWHVQRTRVLSSDQIHDVSLPWTNPANGQSRTWTRGSALQVWRSDHSATLPPPWSPSIDLNYSFPAPYSSLKWSHMLQT